jgi:hypothetical protein
MMAPAPEAGMPVLPAAPIVAGKTSDDMTGSVGFGVGVNAGTSLVVPDAGNLMLKYWMSDAMALVPRLQLGYSKVKGADAGWTFAPQALASFVLLKGASTRLSAGAGFGISLSKNPAATGPVVPGATATDSVIDIFIPVQVGVEHFFTRWFSMGISADFRFLDFTKQGTPWQMSLAANTTSYMGSLFFSSIYASVLVINRYAKLT